MGCLKLTYYPENEPKINTLSGELTSKKSVQNAYSTYRFGFNGKENDNEVKGAGGQQDYGMRIYDTRLGRFLSVDPLMSKFSMLSPYQFSTNNPILNIDLDGLEGVSYRVVRKDPTTGNVTAVKRVIEVDIHIAVNEKGKHGAYSTNSAKQIETIMTGKFNEKGYLDEEGLPVEFKFNFIEFDPKITDPKKLASSLGKKYTPTTYVDNVLGNQFMTRKDVVISRKNILSEGVTTGNKIDIAKIRDYPVGHSECHELSHFLMSAAGYTTASPDQLPESGHKLGGWMQYATKYNDTSGQTMKVEGIDFDFSKETFDQIIKAVPRINDVEE